MNRAFARRQATADSECLTSPESPLCLGGIRRLRRSRGIPIACRWEPSKQRKLATLTVAVGAESVHWNSPSTTPRAKMTGLSSKEAYCHLERSREV